MSTESQPTILAIDTSSEVCSVALAHSGNITEETIKAAREHTQRVLPMVESLLLSAGLTTRDLDAVAVANGPGSFTGLRIGLSIAQGIAYGADVPLIPISTLLAMAHSVVRVQLNDGKQLIVPAIDARMDEIYWSAYQIMDSKVIESREDEYVSKPADCYSHSKQLVGAEKVIAVGSGWRYADEQGRQGLNRLETDFFATAYDIAELALFDFSEGKCMDPMRVQPTYLRNEISWQKRQRIRPVE